MAIDTEDKRRAAMALMPGFSLIDPVPDGSILAEDRAHTTGIFRRDYSATQLVAEGVEAILWPF
jgi:hypothetical protein